MMKKEYSCLIYRVFFTLVGLATIIAQFIFCCLDDLLKSHFFNYFTIQTNIITVVVFLVLTIKTIVLYVKNKEIGIASINPSLYLASVFYITITLLVFWLILAPTSAADLFNSAAAIIMNILLHLIVPLSAIFDWIFFGPHGKLSYKKSFEWLIYPTLYYLHLIIVAQVTMYPYYEYELNGDMVASMYPYLFLDPKLLGIGGVIGVVIGMYIIFELFGCFYLFLDKKINNVRKPYVDA